MPRILIVEDEDNARKGYEQLLQKWGYEVLGVGTAEDALARFGNFQPDSLIADVELPGVTDVTAAHRSLARAKVSACDVKQRLARRGAPGLIANEWAENVTFLQKHSACGADRFLSAPYVNPAGDEAPAIETGQFFLKDTGLQHPAKSLQVARVRRAFLGGGFAGTFRGLQHPLI